MFKKYLNQVLAILARQLSASEENTARSYFEKGYPAKSAAEYLK